LRLAQLTTTDASNQSHAVTTMGLLLNVGEVDKNVAFLGYRQFPDGTRGPAEVKQLCRRHGDIIIAVNGKSLVGKPFKEVIPYLKESIRFAYIRFVHKDCTTDGGSMTSCGNLGRYMFEDLSKTFKEDRRRLLAKRSLPLLEEEEDADDSSTSSEEASDDSVDVADDIESILEKRTRTRVVEGAKTASWLNKKGMNVTKSKFSSESGSAGIDVDDPLFWQKVMPDLLLLKCKLLDLCCDYAITSYCFPSALCLHCMLLINPLPLSLLNKISEMEEWAEKPKPGRKTKKSEGLSKANNKKVAEFMSDLKGVMEDIFD